MRDQGPGPRMVDSRGARVGAAISVFLLVVAFDLHRSGSPERATVLVAAVATAMAVSAATAPRWNALSLPFQVARANGAVGAPQLEDLQRRWDSASRRPSVRPFSWSRWWPGRWRRTASRSC